MLNKFENSPADRILGYMINSESFIKAICIFTFGFVIGGVVCK